MVVHGWDLAQLVESGPQTVPAVPVVSGLLETAAGELQFAIRVGELGEPVILPLAAAAQHIVNVRELLIERVRHSGERFD